MFRLTLGLLAGLAMASLAGQSAGDALVRAQEQFAQKRYKEAVETCAAAGKVAGDERTRLGCLLLEAKARVNLGEFAAAEAVLDRYVTARPQSSEALYLLGYVLERENKPRESLEIYTRAAAVAAPEPNDLKLVALDYVLLNDYPDALIWLKRSLAGDPSNAEAWYSLGRVQMQGGAFVEAEAAFRKAISLAPGDAKAFDNLGLSLEAQNRNEEAAAAYRQAVAAQKGLPHESEQPLLNLGTLLNNQNHSGEALGYLRRAVELAGANVRCQEELSRAFVATGDQRAGIAAMERAVGLDGKNARLHFLLGHLYRKAGEVEKANAEIRTSERLYGAHSTDGAR